MAARPRKAKSAGRRVASSHRAREPRSGPRPFWSGTISFGLVTVPVDLVAATRTARPALRLLTTDGVPLRRRYWCPHDDREVADDQLVRGYEVAGGKHVVVTDEELEALAPRRSHDIDLRRFVPAADVDPAFFERAYFLAPRGEATKPYRLLAEVMERTGRAGIGTFVMAGRERVVAILAAGGVLRAETMRFFDEVRTSTEVGLHRRAKPARAEVTRLRSVIRELTAEALDPELLQDTVERGMLQLVQAKVERDQDIVEAPAAVVDSTEGPDDVPDLLAAIKRSLAVRSGHGNGNGNGTSPRGNGEPDAPRLTELSSTPPASSRDAKKLGAWKAVSRKP